MLKIIKNSHIYNPEDIGKKDIFIAGEKIIEVRENISVPNDFKVEVIDAKGKTVIPGFIDGHVHILGGGGSEGPSSHTHDVGFSSLVMSGITTVVGTLGLDDVYFDIKRVLVKAKALEEDGLTSYIYTGSFKYPSPTIMGSIDRDLIMVEKVVGTKLALFDALASQINEQVFSEILGKIRIGGKFGNKAGIVHIHLGDIPGNYQMLLTSAKRTGTPLNKIVLTHVNRSREVFEQALSCAKQGLIVDVTALLSPDRGISKAIKPAQSIKEFLEGGIPLENITMSSDSNAVQLIVNDQGKVEKMFLTPIDVLIEEFKKAVTEWSLPFSDILKMVTLNVAKVLGIESKKGSIVPGKHADLVFLDKDLNIDTVMAMGKIIVKDAAPVILGKFEIDYHDQSLRLGLKSKNKGGGN